MRNPYDPEVIVGKEIVDLTGERLDKQPEAAAEAIVSALCQLILGSWDRKHHAAVAEYYAKRLVSLMIFPDKEEMH